MQVLEYGWIIYLMKECLSEAGLFKRIFQKNQNEQ